MPYMTITRKCGHNEKVFLYEDEMNNQNSIKNHCEHECEKCFLKHNNINEVKMSYSSYKIEYSDCRTKSNSYDKDSKTIIVYIPK